MENINEHDMTKRMLDALRSTTDNSNTTNIHNSTPLNEDDRSREMLNKIRNVNKVDESNNVIKNLLTENSESDVVKIENDELSEEAKKLYDMVGGVDLKLYEVYPKDRNVVMVGVLDNGIEFKFSKKEQSPYINAENLRLDSDAVETIKRLEAYYKIWSTEWAGKISEYTKTV